MTKYKRGPFEWKSIHPELDPEEVIDSAVVYAYIISNQNALGIVTIMHNGEKPKELPYYIKARGLESGVYWTSPDNHYRTLREAKLRAEHHVKWYPG